MFRGKRFFLQGGKEDVFFLAMVDLIGIGPDEIYRGIDKPIIHEGELQG